jgi:hypothetical protein
LYAIRERRFTPAAQRGLIGCDGEIIDMEETMSEKARLLQEEGQAFGELRQAIDGLSDDDMGRVWLGTWGVREILIHVSGWHDAMVSAFGHIARGEAPYPPGTYDDFDAWNARFVAEKSGVKAGDVVAELGASQRRFVEAAAAVPDVQFEPGGTARDPFDGAGAGHYREHAAQIREWRREAAH